MSTATTMQSPGRIARPGPWQIIAAVLAVLAAPAFFVFEDVLAGAVLLVLALAAGWYADRGGCGGACSAPLEAADRRLLGERPAGSEAVEGEAAGSGASGHEVAGSEAAPRVSRPPSLLRDLSLIAIGLAIIRLIPLAAELDAWSMVKFTLALGGAVAVPYLVSRYVYRDRATAFPWLGSGRWGVFHWAWLVAVLVLGWLILPWYFISSGVYGNWPEVGSPDLIARLFVGVGAVGIWDELFFICTVFTLLLRHFPAWLANLLQSVVFVSFLWELGYREWGPLLTIPFALMQGYIYLRTHSLAYVVTVHLLFDAVVFAVLVHAHNPHLFDVFVTVP